MGDLTLLGKPVNKPITAGELETFPAPPHVPVVSFYTDELTSNCPKTGQPDFYRIWIQYCPMHKCLESKALKLYLWQFRDSGQFIEDLAERIADDLFKALEPNEIEVKLRMAPRGGISIQAVAVRDIEELTLSLGEDEAK